MIFSFTVPTFSVTVPNTQEVCDILEIVDIEYYITNDWADRMTLEFNSEADMTDLINMLPSFY